MKTTFIAILLTLASLVTPAAARSKSYAVIIGNNAPPAGPQADALGTLRYADDDAVRYYQLLSQFSQTTLLATLDDATQRRDAKISSIARTPSLEELRRVFASLAKDMRRDRDAGDEPVLYFVFSGHGALGDAGEAYLALVDGRLTQHVLFDELIGSLPTPRTHVIVDACHAAGVVGARGVFDKETTGATASVSPDEAIAIAGGASLDRYPNVGVLTATTLGNETHEWSAIEAGVFSHEVLSGLSGAADVNGDLVVEYSELEAFVANANRAIKNPRAVPIVVVQSPRADRRAPLIRLSELRGSYLLRGSVGAWGRFSIELGNGRRLIDANLSREQAVAIALPIDTPAYVRSAAGEARVSSTGNQVAVADVRLAPVAVASRGGSIDEDYREHLFAYPYGPSYYTGYVDSHGLISVDFDVQVHVDVPVADSVPSPPAPNELERRGAFALLAVSIGAGALATATGIVAVQSWHEAHDGRIRADAADDAGTYHTMTAIFWPSAAVTALAAFGTWKLFERSRHIQVTPAFTPGGPPGLSVGGSF